MKKFKNTKIQTITKPLALLLTTSLLIASVTACGKTTANTDATAETMKDVSTEYDLNSETSDKTDEKATSESSSEKDKTSSTTEAESKNETATPVVASAKQTASTERRTVATTEHRASATTERQTTAPSAPTTEAPAPAPTPEQPKHEHTWTDVYKTVVDKEAYDEQVLVGYQQKQIRHAWAVPVKEDTWEQLPKIDTAGWTGEQRDQYEKEHGLLSGCLSACWEEYEMVDDPTRPIYNTVHHDAVTHQELDYTYCTGCGKRK